MWWTGSYPNQYIWRGRRLLTSMFAFAPIGMTMMILGELCNFGSYAFIPAIIVTPLGALSVVICAILSSIFLKETLTFFGWCGCFLCIVSPHSRPLSSVAIGSHSARYLGWLRNHRHQWTTREHRRDDKRVSRPVPLSGFHYLRFHDHTFGPNHHLFRRTEVRIHVL